MPAMDMQVVFQGGGAKLYALMAVCEVLEKYETDGKIRITRAGGTSAGAIAAAMLGSEPSIVDEFRTRIVRTANEVLAARRYGLLRSLYRIRNGDPYFVNLDLKTILQNLFAPDGRAMRISDLRFDTEIYFTHLSSLTPELSGREEFLFDALSNSCRIPIAFVGFKSGTTMVDGGLGMNLPVDNFIADQSRNGPTIAISFVTKVVTQQPKDILTYITHLFSAAIEAGVYRSRKLLGSANIHLIDTDLETFDFSGALKDNFGEKYLAIKKDFTSWFDKWLAAQPRQTVLSEEPAWLLKPTFHDSFLPAPVIDQLHGPALTDELTHAEQIKLFDVAIFNDAGAFAGKYRSSTKTRFKIMKRTNVLSFDFEAGAPENLADMQLGISVVDSIPKRLPFSAHVQRIRETGEGLGVFRLFLLFDTALTPDTPDQPLVIHFEATVVDPYPDLGKRRESAVFTRRYGGADEVLLAVAFPRALLRKEPDVVDVATLSSNQLKEAKVELSQEEVVTSSDPVDGNKLIDEMQLNKPPEWYYFTGRKRTNVKQNELFGLAIN
jgi:predicted acylesterase/phospholipase RssA